MNSQVPILLYHDLDSVDYPSEKPNLAARATVVKIGQFQLQMKYLFESGYKTISIGEFFQFVKKREKKPEKLISITFDDGHHTNFHLAYPSLIECGFRATFFVIAGKVNEKYYLSDAQIREMSDNGMEIGSHGLTHTYLPNLDSSKILYELSESKKILETIIDKPVDSFAFPGGHYNREVLETLGICGYKAVCSCLQGLNSSRTNPYLLRRIEIRRNISLNEFKNIFEPWNIAYYRMIDMAKSVARKLVGLDAYSHLRNKLFRYYFLKR